MQPKLVEDRLNTIRRVSERNVSMSLHYWGMDECHYSNLLHRHSFFEVCYVVDGLGWYHQPDDEIALQPGVLFLSKPGVVHQIRSDTGLALVFVAFDLDRTYSSPEWVQQFDSMSSGSGGVLSRRDDTVSAIWETLCRAACRNAPIETLRGLALALLTAIPNALGVGKDAGSEGVVPSPLVERAMKFIGDNIGNPLPLGAVASYLHVSERYLSKLFRESCGFGYNAWVTQQRIQRARELLVRTELPIKVIAETSGFSSVHYFTNVFTRQCQVPPGKYREQYQPRHRFQGRP